MRLQVKGRHIDVTDSLFSYAERKLGKLSRHLSDESRLELELIVEHNPSISENQIAEATIWTKGPVLRARETSTDMYASIDLVADKLERQVKRYRDRRTRKTAQHVATHHLPEPEPVATLPEEDEAVIVKTKQFNMTPMNEEEAALQLELIGHDFYVFVNAESGLVNVIYKRRDGNYGVIEPSPPNGD
jgi:putative sigma-54 modulation protein